MNILLLEDRGVVAYPLKESLEKNNHTVFLAPNISRAKAYWREKKADCIIADLNMPPDGLDEGEAEQTAGGLLTGWIWLRNYVFAEEESMKKRTIILTAYMKELTDIVGDEELEGIALVGKNPLADTDTGSILHHVEEIAKKLEDKDRDKKEEE